MSASLMLGIHQPMDGPVFEKLDDAQNCRRLGMSDARIEPFKGLVDCGPPPNPTLVRDIARICKEVERKTAAVRFNRWVMKVLPAA